MFTKYAERAQAARLAEYEVAELSNEDGTHPVLFVEKISASNPTFLEEQILNAGKEQPELSREQQVERDRATIARHSVRRLGRVFRDDGTPADDADISAFVHAMPIGAFLRLARFCTPDDDAAAPAVPPAELAEKS